ncbi:hypothetical protein PVIIG_05712 [Plasmodium vivax India VII]|uniref:Uncharacterized protein n=1 Tax=Plasmodium vivax India VII TaxID=1077284 RepID=A0A0J9UTG2_PLAVI|nr:hypothetical protein PVIIG_05712 [Plasmodium vivax India VII]
MRNFNGGDIRLYDYTSEPFNPYPGEEHYIGYHPAYDIIISIFSINPFIRNFILAMNNVIY